MAFYGKNVPGILGLHHAKTALQQPAPHFLVLVQPRQLDVNDNKPEFNIATSDSSSCGKEA
jgi:hypothetical protein